jgi:hypothetical protein
VASAVEICEGFVLGACVEESDELVCVEIGRVEIFGEIREQFERFILAYVVSTLEHRLVFSPVFQFDSIVISTYRYKCDRQGNTSLEKTEDFFETFGGGALIFGAAEMPLPDIIVL